MIFLPFDHRKTFVTDIVGLVALETQAQTERISRLKWLIYQGFLQAWLQQNHDPRLAVLVDEEFGNEVIADAAQKQIPLGMPIEKHGQKVFDFFHQDRWMETIERINPSYVKVLVRYNPANRADNELQLARLKLVSDYCLAKSRKLLFELLVPPTDAEVREFGDEYDAKRRTGNTALALREVQEVVRVSLWKLEGFGKQDWVEILLEVKNQTPVVVLGRGEDQDLVNMWLAAASWYKRIIGFAVGRTIFLAPLKKFVAGELTETMVIDEIAGKFTSYLKFWDQQKRQNPQIEL